MGVAQADPPPPGSTWSETFIQEADGTIRDTRDVGPPLPDANYVPGDGIEQNDQRYLYGGRGLYTHFWTLAGLPVESQLALETRNDQIHVALYRQVERERFFTIDRLAVDERSLGGYLSEQVFFTDWIRLEFGLRADAFFFVGIKDRAQLEAVL